MNNQHLIESLNKAMANRITVELWAVLVDARDEIERLNEKLNKVAAAVAA